MKLFKLMRSRIFKDPLLIGNNFECADNSDTPKTSPLTIANGATAEINIPNNCAAVRISSDDDCFICKDSNFNEYDKIYAGMPDTIDCGALDQFYIKNTSGSSIDVYLRFITL